MAFSLTPRQLNQAKEAIEMLSNLSGEEPSTSGLTSGTTSQAVSGTPYNTRSNTTFPVSRRSEAREVLSAANRCLLSMNQLKSKGSDHKAGRRRKIKEEVSSLFGKRKKTGVKCVWKHKFICLANCTQKRIPTTDAEKDELLMAGLGEKEIEFTDLECSAADFRDLLYHYFPSLQEDGGFQFFKCVANSRLLERLSSTTLSSPSMLKSRVGNSRTYIRPIQKSLDLTPIVELPGGATEKCLKCGQIYSLEQLASHFDLCGANSRDDNCDEDEDNTVDLTAFDNSPISSENDDCDILPGPTASDYHYSVIYDDYNINEIQSIENEMVEAAVGDSLNSSDSRLETLAGTSQNETLGNSTSLANKIQCLQKYIDHDSTLHIEVRRNFVLSDALRQARKNKFNPKKFIKVTFVGEGAIDQGGPKREFFRLFAEQANSYFRGDDGQPKFLRNDILAVQRNDFFNIGVFTVLSIIYGGKGLPFLAKPVYDYLTTGCYDVTVPEAEIPDASLKLIITKLRNAESDNDLQEIFVTEEAMDLLYSTGYSKATKSLTLADQVDLLNVLLDFHLMAKVKTEMDQFKAGLSTFEFINQMKENSVIWKPYFVPTNNKLSAELIKGLFQVEYSMQGSRFRPKEEETYIFFVDFLDECEENEVDFCSLEDVLVFFSGADNVPPCGFQDVSPTLVFLHGDAKLPTASTCDLEFRLPATYSDYTKFRDAMVLGLKGHDGFGGI